METDHSPLSLQGMLSIHRATLGLFQSFAKRIQLCLLVLLGGVLGMPLAAHAQFEYATNSGKIVITRYTGTDSYVVIPSTINGLTVASIRTSAFYGCTTVTSVDIPNSVTSIGSGAFTGCSTLESIQVSSLNTTFSSVDGVLLDKSQTTLIRCPEGKVTAYSVPSSVTSVSDGAFANCQQLPGISIPNSVVDIGDNAFSSCGSLQTITIPSSVRGLGYGVFYACSNLTSVSIPNSVTSLGNGAFSGCSSLASITIPNSITNIGTLTFSGCTSLQTIVVPTSVTSIGDYAFFGCTGMTAITIPNTVTSIGYEAFYGCSALANITLPNKIVLIGDNAFYGCSGLNSVTLPTTLVSIGNYAFAGCSNLTSIKIPYKVTTIGSYAFSDCISLNSVTLSNQVMNIGDAAFAGCVSLPAIRLSTKLKSIGTNTFSGCISLTSITFPSSVTSVGNYAFSGCVSLTNVTMTSKVRSIGNNAFYGCTSLSSITIPAAVSTIGDAAFAECTALTKIVIPAKVRIVENGLLAGCTSLTNVTLYGGLRTIQGNAFANCTNLRSIALPTSLTSIGNNAFENCANLLSVVIPANVTSIEDYAFQNCSGLTNVSLPAKITIIGDYTFSGCTSLTSIVIPNKVTRIGNYSFMGCSSLASVTVGTAVNSIGGGAFAGCSNLPYITLPKSVTSLGFQSFSDCPALKGVFFEGNMPSSVDDGVFLGSPNVTVFYRTGATGWGTSLSGAPVVVLTVPVIYQSPTNQFVQPGGVATFKVGAFGPLPLTYQWRLNGTNIAGAVAATYVIKSVQSKNAGVYSAVVSSKYGSAISETATLSVRPTVAITTPKSNSTISNAVVTVQGTATGNMSGGYVMYRIGNDEWANAQGNATWAASVTLSPGVNWIQIMAVDTEGNASYVVSNKVTYVTSAYLTLGVLGNGSVTGTVSSKTNKVSLLAVGQAVSLKAVPATGQVFYKWSGWTSANTAALAFVMPTNDISLNAQFIPSPYPSAAGVYRGLIAGDNSFDGTTSGGFNVAVTSGGAYSAKLLFASRSVSASGSLSFVDGQTNRVGSLFTNQIAGRVVRVSFTIDLDSGAVSGSMMDVSSTIDYAILEGYKAANTNLGQFNIVLSAATNSPAGFGYGTVTATGSGAVLSLTLSDEKAAVSALVSDRLNNGLIPVFSPLYGTGGFVIGWLNQTNQQIEASTLAWHKNQGASATFFNSGFDFWLDVQGGLYTAATNLTAWGTGVLNVDGDDLSNSSVAFQSGTLTGGALSIPVNDGTHAAAPFKLTTSSGKVTLYGAGYAGTGILIPFTAPNPGIYGYVTNTVEGVGVVHPVKALPVTGSGN